MHVCQSASACSIRRPPATLRYGITAFEFNSEPKGLGSEPEGNVKNVRVDVPPGLAVNPASPAEVLGRGHLKKTRCEMSAPKYGTDELTGLRTAARAQTIPITGAVYNLEQPARDPVWSSGFNVSLVAPLVVNEHICPRCGT